MGFVKPTVAAALVVAGLFTGGTTAVAGRGTGGGRRARRAVHRHDVARGQDPHLPSSACSQRNSLHAGQSRKAECWVHGESITDAGITNDIWLQVDDADEDNGDLWSSAVYFVGDQYAGLPADARCADSPEPARR